MSRLVAYRHAAYSTPLRTLASTVPGRFHRRGQIAQYFCLHPLGPAAEILRRQVGLDGAEDVGDVILNLWAIQVPDDGIVSISFENCGDYEMLPEELVDDFYLPTQDLADRLRANDVPGIRVPSAALPGTENLVLFGPRVAGDYLGEPVQPEELPTGHLTDYAHPPAELYPWVRFIGRPHTALFDWHPTGVSEHFHDPYRATGRGQRPGR